MESLKVFTTFSGYDSQCLALKYSDIPFELVGWSEINEFSITAHNALFPEYKDNNFGDVSKIDWTRIPDFDFLTYSSPCQDISCSGLQNGLEKGSGTRSSLIWDIEKAIKIKRPKYMLMENVKNIINDKFIGDFNKWLEILESYGYRSYYKVMNGIDYDIPQNRERVFVVSIRNDIDKGFQFPEQMQFTNTLDNILETKVDVQYYLPKGSTDTLVKDTIERNSHRKQNMTKPVHTDLFSNISENKDTTTHIIDDKWFDYTLRNLTPRECFRLMGVKDEDIDKIMSAVNNDRQLYSLAGNSIITNCMCCIYNNLFSEYNPTKLATVKHKEKSSIRNIVCASRGRILEYNKEERLSKGMSAYTQVLELLSENYTNTLTTVSKDNYILTAMPKYM